MALKVKVIVYDRHKKCGGFNLLIELGLYMRVDDTKLQERQSSVYDNEEYRIQN